MTAEQCQQRAADCSASAAASLDGSVAAEFLMLAAQWRAMAVRQIFLGHADPVEPASSTARPVKGPEALPAENGKTDKRG
ncbi:MAG: hypothetical protein ACXWKN_12400 [Phenylobacterium sp.]